MPKTDARSRAALQDETLRRRAILSLRLFVELAWPILEPATPFVPNWHIDLICEYLQAITEGRIRRLVINMPPRYGKSLLVSVLWPCWEWIAYPSKRWLFASYADSLASRHSLDRRRLLTSEWYHQRWGDVVRLTKDQHTKAEFHNTRRGVMLATSVGGSVTGKGGNRLILDDPHNPVQAESDALRAHAIDFYTSTLSTRLDDPRNDAIVLVMQRLHTRDLSAVLLEQEFEHLSLPALAPAHTTITFPLSDRTVVRETDAPLWPERQSRAELDGQLAVLGSYGFAGQYQQNPVPRNGGMFQRDWWQWFDHPPAHDEVIQSWDLSFKDSIGSDYVVGLVACRVGANVYILDRYKAKASFVDTCHAIKRMVARYPQTRTILIEDAANGPAVVNVLRQQVPGIIAVRPDGNKLSRASAVQPRIEAGQVFLPRPRLADGHLRAEYAWVEDFVESLAVFPKGDHDDDVDALSQLLLRCQRSGGVSASAVMRAMRDDDRDASDRGGAHDPGHLYRGYL